MKRLLKPNSHYVISFGGIFLFGLLWLLAVPLGKFLCTVITRYPRLSRTFLSVFLVILMIGQQLHAALCLALICCMFAEEMLQ